MAKKQRRSGATRNSKRSHSGKAGEHVLRQSALRAVRRALARAEEAVRTIDTGLRKKLRAKRRNTGAARRGKAHSG